MIELNRKRMRTESVKVGNGPTEALLIFTKKDRARSSHYEGGQGANIQIQKSLPVVQRPVAEAPIQFVASPG
jgi:hypothetical protein